MDKKDIIVMGGLGVSPRRDRDVDRILHRGGGHIMRYLLMYTEINQW